MSLRSAIFGSCVAALLAGCAGGGEPSEQALHEGSAAIHSGVAAGVAAVDSQGVLTVEGRYNPCLCPAPDFEVRVRGEWTRVLMAGDTELVDDLRQVSQERSALPYLESLSLRGQFDGLGKFDETGVEYPLFEVEDFHIE